VPVFVTVGTAAHRGFRRLRRGAKTAKSIENMRVSLVPVERIELPTFGLQNRLSVNRISPERVPKAKFVDSIIGYSESRN
jgi:hypothetical protein